ncbi:hypothetical protein EW145_g8108 [Phellinidium pouzarii]|uniref:KOW domain-containing protein n=1 Tax=Phellinidium pouzarii TaxID=167371 RepID=A0A4S4K9I3_9AGAM|nr:hypothetical protein EW145_g8108 [Phellinidium pouzarii]
MPKRTRDDDVAALLDLEAGVASSDEDEDEDNFADTFINDEEVEFPSMLRGIYTQRSISPVATNVAGPSRMNTELDVGMLMPTHGPEFDVESTARRFQERSRREREQEEPQTAFFLWMIRCVFSKEKENATRLQDRINELSKPWRTFAIRTLPGRFYIDAPSRKDVDFVRRNLHGIERAPLMFVPEEEQDFIVQLCDGANMTTALRDYTVGDWVTVQHGLYKGDLGRVRNVMQNGIGDTVEVAVVPRVCDKRVHRSQRPPPALFNKDRMLFEYGADCLKQVSESGWIFQGRTNNLYNESDRLCYLRVQALHYIRKAAPHPCDLGYFAVTESEFGALDCGEPFLHCGDHVRITSGPQASLSGIVGAIQDKETVDLYDIVDSKGELKLFDLRLKVDQVRRVLRPGDHVRMKVGPGAGVEGMILAVDDTSLVYRPRANVSTQAEVKVRTQWVETYDPDFKMGRESGTPNKGLARYHDPYQGLRVLFLEMSGHERACTPPPEGIADFPEDDYAAEANQAPVLTQQDHAFALISPPTATAKKSSATSTAVFALPSGRTI